jgi:hypothetical protein
MFLAALHGTSLYRWISRGSSSVMRPFLEGLKIFFAALGDDIAGWTWSRKTLICETGGKVTGRSELAQLVYYLRP